MQPISTKSLRDLVRGREAVVRRLEEREPALMQELRLYDTAISHYDRQGEKPYASIKWPKNAIPLCLERNQAWMTREEIQRDLEAGGFVFDPFTFPQLLSDALRYHTRRGTLARRDVQGNSIATGSHKPHAKFQNDVFGLSEWVNDPAIRTLKENSGK